MTLFVFELFKIIRFLDIQLHVRNDKDETVLVPPLCKFINIKSHTTKENEERVTYLLRIKKKKEKKKGKKKKKKENEQDKRKRFSP